MAFTIRAATPADLPAIATLDIAAHQPNSALLNINLLPPDDMHALYVSRYAHFMSQPDHYQTLVAIAPQSETTQGGDIAGFLVGAKPKVDGIKEEEWDPVLPEDTPKEKIEWLTELMKVMKEDKMKYYKNDMWGSLSSSHNPFHSPLPPESCATLYIC